MNTPHDDDAPEPPAIPRIGPWEVAEDGLWTRFETVGGPLRRAVAAWAWRDTTGFRWTTMQACGRGMASIDDAKREADMALGRCPACPDGWIGDPSTEWMCRACQLSAPPHGPAAEPPAIPITLPSTPELDAVSVPYEPVAPEPYWHGPPVARQGGRVQCSGCGAVFRAPAWAEGERLAEATCPDCERDCVFERDDIIACVVSPPVARQSREPGNGAVSGVADRVAALEAKLSAELASIARHMHADRAALEARIAALEAVAHAPVDLRPLCEEVVRNRLRATHLELGEHQARIAALERPGPVAPLLGDHKEALAERARIVAMLRRQAAAEATHDEAAVLLYAAKRIEDGKHLPVKP